MATNTLGYLFTQFLFNAERTGYTLSDINDHLKQFGFPFENEPQVNDQKVERIIIEPEVGRDFSRYAFGERIQNKRRTMLSVIRHLIETGLSVTEINGIGFGLRFSRPWLKPINEIIGDLERRYFIKPGETILIDGNEYAILSQWGGPRFREAVHILNRKYRLDIKQIS